MYISLVLLSSFLCVITAQIIYDKTNQGITSLVGCSIPANTEWARYWDNSISHIPTGCFQNLPNLVKIYLHRNIISSIDNYAYSGVPTVTYIDLGWNKFSVICKHQFSGLPNLLSLHLYANEIHTIEPESFKNNTALRTLSLWENKLLVICKDMFSGLRDLQTLHLQENSIKRIEPGSFHDNSNLYELKLHDNLLENLYECMFDVENHPNNIQNFYIYNNPLLCDEYLLWLKLVDTTWITVKTPDPNMPPFEDLPTICAGPDSLIGRTWQSISTTDLISNASGKANAYVFSSSNRRARTIKLVN